MAEPKNRVGQPLKIKTLKELQEKIEDYFAYCDNRIKQIHTKEGTEIAINHPAPYTMSGLARSLGIDRDTLLNYSKREEYFGTIKEARAKVAEDVETRLMETSNQAGAIFNLKNNFGWKDKTEQDLKVDGVVPIMKVENVRRDDSNKKD